MLCSLSTKLSEQELRAINDLEKELGKTLLAFSCHRVDPAEISQEQLAKLQAVEQQMGISLIAVQNNNP